MLPQDTRTDQRRDREAAKGRQEGASFPLRFRAKREHLKRFEGFYPESQGRDCLLCADFAHTSRDPAAEDPGSDVQGYLAHNKTQPPRTLQYGYA